METETKNLGGGIGFGGMLSLMFIAFKLLGVITWSWWWVLAPLWIPVVFFTGLFGGMFVLLLLTQFIIDRHK